MKRTEVIAQLGSELGPWFESAGFKRTHQASPGMISWSRPHGDEYTTVWCQISQDKWDRYRGSKFVVDFQLAPETEAGALGTARKRIARMLDEEQRETVRQIQNRVISSLSKPPKTHRNLNISSEISEWYLAHFEPVAEPYPEHLDIWFRYAKPEHVSQWAQFVLQLLPECVREIEMLSWRFRLESREYFF